MTSSDQKSRLTKRRDVDVASLRRSWSRVRIGYLLVLVTLVAVVLSGSPSDAFAYFLCLYYLLITADIFLDYGRVTSETLRRTVELFMVASIGAVIAIGVTDIVEHFLAATPGPGDVREFEIVSVLYATDRMEGYSPIEVDPTSNEHYLRFPKSAYIADRGELNFGKCFVSVPKEHKIGHLEEPSITRLELWEDPGKHVALMGVTRMSREEFTRVLSDASGQCATDGAFVFIHGYNTSFENAARRTAQITYDIEYQGVPVFYSWPADEMMWQYPRDESNAEWAAANVREFLLLIAREWQSKHVILIAHSMGCRVVSQAIAQMNPLERESLRSFREIILTAPDIDATIFKRDLAPALLEVASNATLYASDNDRALMASKWFNGYRCAGDAGDSILILHGIETIDASFVDTDFLGHSYFAQSRSVLSDMFYLVRDGSRATDRFALTPVTLPVGTYWRFRRED